MSLTKTIGLPKGRAGLFTLDGVADGYEAFALAQISKEIAADAPMIFVARDGQKLPQLVEALAFVAGVDVVGERPELRHDHQIEDADPQEVGDADRPSGPSGHVERDEAPDEEPRHHPQEHVADAGRALAGEHDPEQRVQLVHRPVGGDPLIELRDP